MSRSVAISAPPTPWLALVNALALRTRPVPCQSYGDPLSDDPQTRADTAAVVCVGCPVIDLCASAGESHEFGVWGGVDRTVTRQTKRRRGEEVTL